MSLASRLTSLATRVANEIKAVRGVADSKVPITSVGVASGLATLDATGKLSSAQVPDSLLGALKYKGVWNASTNSPVIPAAAAGNLGWYYVVQTAGVTSVGGVAEWQIGDWLVSNGTAWNKLDNTDQVISVAGLQGPISAASLKAALALGISDVSTLTDALAGKLSTSLVAAPDGLASLDATGKVPLIQLPDGIGGGGSSPNALTSDALATIQSYLLKTVEGGTFADLETPVALRVYDIDFAARSVHFVWPAQYLTFTISGAPQTVVSYDENDQPLAVSLPMTTTTVALHLFFGADATVTWPENVWFGSNYATGSSPPALGYYDIILFTHAAALPLMGFPPDGVKAVHIPVA